MIVRVLFAVLLFAVPTAAFADRSDADECSRKLSGLALETYHASIGGAQGGKTLKQAIGGYLKPLVDSGKISETDGKKSGFRAAMCVRLVHRK
jgi:hypothetical protein